MIDDSERDNPIVQDRDLQHAVARVLWRSELPPKLNVDERKAHWSDERKKYQIAANKFLRLAETEGLHVALASTLSGAIIDHSDDDNAGS